MGEDVQVVLSASVVRLLQRRRRVAKKKRSKLGAFVFISLLLSYVHPRAYVLGFKMYRRTTIMS